MIIPVLHRILVKQDKVEETDEIYKRATKAGIHIPVSEEQKARAQAGVDKGKVIAVGKTAFKDFGTDSPIEIGDYVAYARFSGKILTDPFTQEEFVALNDEDIVCIFRQE
jgi:co-chaperonin GroES (HSP10)